jgi:hypothetical protein
MVESEKKMERKVEAAMEQIKILILDFGKECGDKKVLESEVLRIIKEKVIVQDTHLEKKSTRS